MNGAEVAGQLRGVRAHDGASTPLLFDRASTALELGLVLDQVASHAAGPLGAARIRARRPVTNLTVIAAELEAVRQVVQLFGRGLPVEVLPVPEIADLVARLRIDGSVLSPIELGLLKRTVQAARVVSRELEVRLPEAPALARYLVPPPSKPLERRLIDAIDDAGELLDTASPALFAARRAVHAARERLIKKLEQIVRGLDPAVVAAGGQVTIRGDRYVVPIRRDSRSRPDGIIHDESGSHGTLFVEPSGAVEFGNALRSAVADAEREALKVLRELTDLCRPERPVIIAAHEMCVATDDLVARARYAHRHGGEPPALVPADSPMVLRAARHPLLLARGQDVVPFDLSLSGAERTLLISGPNAGGKTVLLKAVGLIACLTQSGIVPPVAAGTQMPVFGEIFADIGDHQSIAADLSTFSAHLVVVRDVLARAGGDALVLIDEIGSGTDPAEGAALAGAVLRTLTERSARTIATTHLGALKTLASETPGIVNGSLEFDVESLSPTFHFHQGIPGRSYGLAMAKRLGIDPAVIARAEAELPAEGRALEEMLAQVEARDQALRADAAVAADRLEEAAMREESLAARLDRLAVRERDVERREKELERAGRKGAREHLLRAREQVEQALRQAQGAVDAAEAREARKLLEHAADREAAALQELEEAVAEGEESGGLVVGGRVRMVGGGQGTLLEIRSDGRAIIGSGAVKMVMPAAALTPIAGPPPKPRETAPSVVEPSAGAATEIDLRGMRADEAETATVAAIDAAVLADNPYLRIIHGMGTGVLRDRVQRVLKADRRITKFEFAPRNQGGTGVTVAEFGAVS